MEVIATMYRMLIHIAIASITANIVGFRGFDSSMILNERGGMPMPIGDFPESLTQAILVGIMLVGRLGVYPLIYTWCPLTSNRID